MTFFRKVLFLSLILSYSILSIQSQPKVSTTSVSESFIKDEVKKSSELTLPDNFFDNWITSHVNIGKRNYNSISNRIEINLKQGSSEFFYPVKGQLYGGFCYRGRIVHSGVDIGLKRGTPVHAAFDGVVRMAKYYGGYGKIVVVRHLNGLETVYSHLSKIKVKLNQHIKAGEIVGLGGRTGRATANHLHFETRINGIAFDPEEMLDVWNHKLKSDTLVLTKVSYLPKYKIYRSRKGKKAYDLNYDDNGNLITPKDESIKGADSTNLIAINNNSIEKPLIKKHSEKIYYRVRKGDSLSIIANKNGTTVNRLVKLNGRKIKKKLSVGKSIRVK